ncbi:MAG: hypothetical protein ACC707_02755 [Thiohalomonadales bacterium]
MNNITHPDTDSLLGFLERPEDSEFAELSLHLATCNHCRNELIEVSSLKQRLCNYKHRDLSKPSKTEKTKDSLYANLHFASHSEAMRQGLAAHVLRSPADSINKTSSTFDPHPSNNAGIRTTKLSNPKFFAHFLTYFQWRPPLWSALAMTALLLLTVTYNLQVLTFKPSSLDIIAYQDNPVLTYTSQRDDNPGLGFFSDIQTSTKRFSGITITQENSHNITVTWPKIENSRSATIRLYQLSKGDRQLVDEQEVPGNEVTFSIESLETLQDAARFEWTLSGTTTDRKEFRTSGGFVIARPK